MKNGDQNTPSSGRGAVNALPSASTELAAIRDALAAGATSAFFTHPRDDNHWRENEALAHACNPAAMTAVLAYVDALQAEIQALRADARDPLQGAANWLYTGLVECTVADLQSRLLVGYNRAKRLFDAARTPHD